MTWRMGVFCVVTVVLVRSGECKKCILGSGSLEGMLVVE
jgi:hypothetical protein